MEERFVEFIFGLTSPPRYVAMSGRSMDPIYWLAKLSYRIDQNGRLAREISNARHKGLCNVIQALNNLPGFGTLKWSSSWAITKP